MTSTITEERLHEILIENERKLIEDLWIPELITEYKVVKQRPSYRRALQRIRNIGEYKLQLSVNLHPIVVREWLKLYSSMINYEGNYRHTEKGIILLYQLLKGKSRAVLPIPETTYGAICSHLWDDYENIKKMHQWTDKWFSIFSNPTVISIHARLYNPPNLSRVTLIVDGKDISVHLQKIKND